jgi:CubicO group peptidase (beta-lactamase class C family)
VSAVPAGGVGGFVAPGFEPVAAAFAENFARREELGAAFAATLDGELVVDLWGGVADAAADRPWQEDTLQVIFSGTKALVAICVLALMERGALDLDEPVCRSWPEFAAAGKEAVTVRQLVTHTARLPAIVAPLQVEDVTDDRRMAALLAEQPQLADPRAGRVYHALTYGWLVGELIRRVDGRSVGRFFAEEVAAPLDLEVFIGLPAEHEHRVSRLEVADTWGACPAFDPARLAEDELLRLVWGNPEVWRGDALAWNLPAYHAAEIPGAGGIATARSLALMYGNLDRVLSSETLRRGTAELERRTEPLLGEPQVFGVGFELSSELRQLGPVDDAFGHTGAGGSVHGAWPGHRVGFSYAMNRMRDDQAEGDERPKALLQALHACLPRP